MASRDKRSKKNTLREKLADAGDEFDTDEIYHLVYDLFRAMKRGGCTPQTLFGRGYKSFTDLPKNQWERLVRNLLALRAMHVAPKLILRLLKEEPGFETDTLKKVFKDSLGFYRIQHRAVTWVLHRADALHQLVRDKGLRSALVTEDFTATGVPAAVRIAVAAEIPAIPLSPIAALRSLHRLTELENDSQDQDSPDARAEYAYRLFAFGSYLEAHRVVEAVLKADPWHGMTNYVGAMLHHAEALARSWTAGQKSFIVEITANDRAGLASDAHEEEALQARGDAYSHEQQGLVQYVIALKHWPRHQQYYDHSRRREEVLRTTVVLLAQRARDREPGGGLGLHGLLPLHLGGASAPDLDAMAIEVLRSAERGPHDSGFGSRPQEGLYWLEAYRVLDAKEYERFSRVWLARLDRCNADDASALADHPTFIEHLRRLVPSRAGHEAILQKLEQFCHNRVRNTWRRAKWELLTSDMREHYKARRLEEALPDAKERVESGTDPYRHGADVYDHVRVVFDLARAALDLNDPVASARWLRQIVDTYPKLFKTLSPHGRGDYLTEIDEDSCEYEDGFGNTEDILYGDLALDDVPAESTPLGLLVVRLLDSDQIDEGEKAALRALLSRGDNR